MLWHYYHYHSLTHLSFSYEHLLMFFYWSLSDSKSPGLFWADLNNAVVLMVSNRPLIPKPSSPWTNLLGGIIITIHSLELFTSAIADGFSLKSEWQQVSPTLLSILAVLNNAIIWMVSTRLTTSKSSSPFSNPLVTVSNTPITIGIIVTCMFHSFFSSLARSGLLLLFQIFLVIYHCL